MILILLACFILGLGIFYLFSFLLNTLVNYLVFWFCDQETIEAHFKSKHVSKQKS